MKLRIIFILGFMLLIGSLKADWVSLGGTISTYTVRAIAFSGGNMFAGTDPYGVFVSTDNGSTWEARNNGLPGSSGLIMSMTVIGTSVYAAVWGQGIWVTTNSGTSWSPRTGADSYTRCLYSNGANLYAGGLYGLYISTNGGANWVSSSSGIPSGAYPVTSFAFSGSNIYAGCYSTTGGVYLSTNGGANWIAKNNGIFQLSVYSLYAGGSFLLAGVAATPSVFKSSDLGESWDASGVGLQNNGVNSIISSGGNIITGAAVGVYYSSNQGTNWSNMSTGLPANQPANTLVISGGNIYAAIGTVGIWKRSVGEVGVTNLATNTPKDFSLLQNYPNPFNPTTKIQFSIPFLRGVDAEGDGLPAAGRGVLTKLIVYDMLGREAAVVLNEDLAPGTYEVEFDAGKLSSGIYYYKLQSGNYSQTRKMILVK